MASHLDIYGARLISFIYLAGAVGRDPRPSRRRRRCGPGRRFSPACSLLRLEDRVVPSTFTVTSAADSGVGTLRQAIVNANTGAGDDTVVFNLQANSIINLTSGLLNIKPTTLDDGLLIDGTNANRPVTINALNNLTPGIPPASPGAPDPGIFTIDATDLGSNLISNLIMTGGVRPQAAGPAVYGGAIDGNGSGALFVLNDTFLNNTADFGGAVAYHPANPVAGALVVDGSTFGKLIGGAPDASSANRATFQGGAIYYLNSGGSGSLQVSNSLFYGNNAINDASGAASSGAYGGAVFAFTGAAQATSILSSTFIGNKATGQNGGNGGGGAVYSDGNSEVVTVNGTTFTGNAAQGGGGLAAGGSGGAGVGGAAYLVGSSTSVGNTTFNSNSAAGGAGVGNGNGGYAGGGALFTAGDTLSLSNNTTFNSDTVTGGAGGAATAANAAGGNGGAAQGGAFYSDQPVATVFGLFNSNTATGGAGGVGTGTGTGGNGGEADGGAVFGNNNLSLTLAGFFGNVARGGNGAGSGAGGAGGNGGDAFGSSVDDNGGSLALSGSTVLVNLAQGGAGGPGNNAPGGRGGNASGATWSAGGFFSVANTFYFQNLSLGGTGGAATAGNGATATAGNGGSARGAIAGANFLSVTSTNFINNVALGAGGGTGLGTGTGVGNGGGGGQAAGGAIDFDQISFSLTGVSGQATFTGNVVQGGPGGASTTTGGKGGAGGDAAGGAVYNGAGHALVSFATFSSTAIGAPGNAATAGNTAAGGAGGNYGGGNTPAGGTGAGGSAEGGAFENAGSLTAGAVVISDSKATGGAGGSVTSAATSVATLGAAGNAYGGGLSNGGKATGALNPGTVIVVVSGKAVLTSVPGTPDVVSNNTATGGASVAGGGGSGSGLGGGLYNNSSAQVDGALISGNAAAGGNGYGGGAFNDVGGTFVLTSATVTGNTAATVGAALYNQGTARRYFVTVSGSVVNWPGSF